MDDAVIFKIIVWIVLIWWFLSSTSKSDDSKSKNESKSNDKVPLKPKENEKSKSQNISVNTSIVEKKVDNVIQTSELNEITLSNSSAFSSELQKMGIEYFYHMTHMENLSSIMHYGLLSHNSAHKKNLVCKDISNHQVNIRRAKIDPINSMSLHEYVPLYLNPRNPMLYVRRNIQAKILILCFEANKILNIGNVIYTDGNAASNTTKFYSSVSDFNKLDWNCLHLDYWSGIIDGKRKKCAEVLVPNYIPSSLIHKIVCYNSNAVTIVKSHNFKKKIIVDIDNGKIYF